MVEIVCDAALRGPIGHAVSVVQQEPVESPPSTAKIRAAFEALRPSNVLLRSSIFTTKAPQIGSPPKAFG